jgi:hypothetical protein
MPRAIELHSKDAIVYIAMFPFNITQTEAVAHLRAVAKQNFDAIQYTAVMNLQDGKTVSHPQHLPEAHLMPVALHMHKRMHTHMHTQMHALTHSHGCAHAYASMHVSAYGPSPVGRSSIVRCPVHDTDVSSRHGCRSGCASLSDQTA